VGIFGTDLRVYHEHDLIGALPLPAPVGDDPQLSLSAVLEDGGFIGFHAPADRDVLVHEVTPDGLVGDWFPIRIPGADAFRLWGVVANRTHVCVRWILDQPPHSSPVPSSLACIPRP
jgi:hypothetical protein